jgi:FixJ family two-component response regulator
MLRASGFVVKTFASAAEFLTRPELNVPGCVLVDLQMPGLSGLDLQEALAKAGHRMPVIFLSGHGDIPITVQAMRRGAEDFLTKRAPKKELLDAVKRALARDARERAEGARLEALRARFAALTPRELDEVLKHVVQGKLNKQIADDLGIHERTVKLHRTAITTKFGVHSVAELTKLWMEAGE